MTAFTKIRICHKLNAIITKVAIITEVATTKFTKFIVHISPLLPPQNWILEGSSSLFEATGGLAYVHEATILLPFSWRDSVDQDQEELVDTYDIAVEVEMMMVMMMMMRRRRRRRKRRRRRRR